MPALECADPLQRRRYSVEVADPPPCACTSVAVAAEAGQAAPAAGPRPSMPAQTRRAHAPRLMGSSTGR
eukprot:363348-Chlamydomonas_euryale.AAC.13